MQNAHKECFKAALASGNFRNRNTVKFPHLIAPQLSPSTKTSHYRNSATKPPGSLWQHWRLDKVQVLCQADSLSAQVDALRWLLIRYLSYQNHQFKGYLWNPLNCSVFAQTIENRGEGDIYEGVKKTAGNMQNISGHYLSLKD